jgi:signal transduction histidine kinase
MTQQLKAGSLDDLDLNDLVMKVVIPFKQHSFKSLEVLKESDEELDLSLSSKSKKLNNAEIISIYKCKGRITKIDRHVKGAEVTFQLEAPPEISTITL